MTTSKSGALSAALRGPAPIVWLVLVATTLVSWALGSHHGLENYTVVASAAVLVIAFIKVYLVGSYFMELREAPTFLRAIFGAYCALVCTLLLSVYLLA